MAQSIMLEQRRFILKTLAAGGLWMTAASLHAARGQKKKEVVWKEERIESPTIAASSDLHPLLTEIIRGFEAETRMRPRIVLGAAGRFYSQILEGVPFEMFLSSDEEFVAKLLNAGKTEGPGDVYAIGRLAFYVPAGSPIKADNFLGDVRSALRDGRLQHFVIANSHVDPYGQRAEQSLRSKWVWEEIQPLLMIGEDVAQAAQMAVNGVAQAGLVAYSQASQLMMTRGGRCVLVADALCDPLRERMVLLKNASNATRRFYQYMLADKARNSLRRHGFQLPD